MWISNFWKGKVHLYIPYIHRRICEGWKTKNIVSGRIMSDFLNSAYLYFSLCLECTHVIVKNNKSFITKKGVTNSS